MPTMALFTTLLVATTVAAAAPEDRCESAQHKVTAKYAACRHKAEAKAVKTGTAASFATCDTKLVKAWAKTRAKVAKADATCRYDADDAEIRAVVAADVDQRAAAFGGAGFPRCGDGAVNVAGELCDGSDLAGLACTDLGFGGGTLGCTTGCRLNTAPCAPTCPPGSIACNGTCVSLFSDNLHCGSCGIACVGGTRCELGACAPTAP